MADLWLYDPVYCDNRLCIGNCDACPIADDMLGDKEDDIL